MKSRPILFSGPMVRAILDGRKTQTRRIVQGAENKKWHAGPCGILDPGPVHWNIGGTAFKCPYGQPGDQLWVRESFANLALSGYTEVIVYRADGTHSEGDGIGCSLPDGVRWQPSIHMPRKACRIELEITDVRVERLHDITEADAWAEGVWHFPEPKSITSGITRFQSLWISINGQDSWDANPWVWVVEFKRI